MPRRLRLERRLNPVRWVANEAKVAGGEMIVAVVAVAVAVNAEARGDLVPLLRKRTMAVLRKTS